MSLLEQNTTRRSFISQCQLSLLRLAAFLSLFPLGAVFCYVLWKGLPGLSLALITELPKPLGEPGGGIAHAILGSLTLVFGASLLGIPWGVCVGVYLSEYAKQSRLATWVRMSTNILASIPSILIGLFVYAWVVLPLKHFSGYAGSLALMLILIPPIARTVEEILRLSPPELKEVGLALGLPRWRVLWSIVILGNRKAILSAIMLSVGRIMGETAPLLFTAFNTMYWQRSFNEPIASLPIQVYQYAVSPYESWHQQAWSGALLLIGFVFMLNFLTRVWAKS